MGEVEDYDEDIHEPWPIKKGNGPDIIDSMKPTFYFNVKNKQEEQQRRQESLDSKDHVSQTPCWVNTPSNSSQFGSLNGTGAIDAEDLMQAIQENNPKPKILKKPIDPSKKERVVIQSFGG